MNLVIIAVIGENNELGKDNKLLWNIKEDLEFFKNKTMGNYILMGKNTFLSLPKILPGRKHIVISTTLKSIEGVKIYKNIEEFLKDFKDYKENIYVIGGALIYKEFLPMVNEMYLTHINENKECDALFPKFDINEWNKVIMGNYDINGLKYNRVHYLRKTPNKNSSANF